MTAKLEPNGAQTPFPEAPNITFEVLPSITSLAGRPRCADETAFAALRHAVLGAEADTNTNTDIGTFGTSFGGPERGGDEFDHRPAARGLSGFEENGQSQVLLPASAAMPWPRLKIVAQHFAPSKTVSAAMSRVPPRCEESPNQNLAEIKRS